MIRKKNLLILLLAFFAIPFAQAKTTKTKEPTPCEKFYASDAAGVRVEGSTSVYNTLIDPNAEDLHARIKYFARDNGSGRGVLALIKGTADVAMISAPLSSVLEQINGVKDQKHQLNDFVVHPLGYVQVAVIVNPNNPLADAKPGTLTASELKQILTGKVEKWIDVGVSRDSDILLVMESEGGGIRSVVQETLMHNHPYWKETRLLAKASQINNLVFQHPSAIGLVSSAQVKDTVVQIDVRGFKVFQSLALVTHGQPSPETQRFIDILKEYALENPGVSNEQPDVMYKE